MTEWTQSEVRKTNDRSNKNNVELHDKLDQTKKEFETYKIETKETLERITKNIEKLRRNLNEQQLAHKSDIQAVKLDSKESLKEQDSRFTTNLADLRKQMTVIIDANDPELKPVGVTDVGSGANTPSSSHSRSPSATKHSNIRVDRASHMKGRGISFKPTNKKPIKQGTGDMPPKIGVKQMRSPKNSSKALNEFSQAFE